MFTADSTKEKAARAFVLPVEQIRYYDELNNDQRGSAAAKWGSVPSRSNYVYAVKRDGELVSDRKAIADVIRNDWR